MIATEKQLQASRAAVSRFRAAIAAMDGGSLADADLDPQMRRAQIEAARSQLDSILTEIEEYEGLRSGGRTAIDVESLSDLPIALIQARIAAGLTQRDLAERLNLREQQIQRYEANRYEAAGFERLLEVSEAIGVRLAGRLRLELDRRPGRGEGGKTALLSRLGSVGLDESFIRRRLAADIVLDEAGIAVLRDRVCSVFDWSADALMVPGLPDPSRLGGSLARFKMPRGREGRSAAAYAAYAFRLATICAAAMASKPRLPIPSDWKAFRALLVTRRGCVDLKAAIALAWDLGVVVLPLEDPGSFHGACWRVGGVNVIVLKQAARYPARWLFDLLHELWHAGQNPEAPEFEVIEGSETSVDRLTSPDERMASWFAGQVMLDGRAEELFKVSIDSIAGELSELKTAVIRTARKEGVPADWLANYVAFRLSLQKDNWWGAATNLQDRSFDPLHFAREVFFERFDFGRIPENELQLLTLALNDGDVHDDD